MLPFVNMFSKSLKKKFSRKITNTGFYSCFNFSENIFLRILTKKLNEGKNIFGF